MSESITSVVSDPAKRESSRDLCAKESWQNKRHPNVMALMKRCFMKLAYIRMVFLVIMTGVFVKGLICCSDSCLAYNFSRFFYQQYDR